MKNKLVIACVLLGLAGLAIALFPKIYTGDFCAVTITHIEIKPNGKTVVDYTMRVSSGTPVTERFVDGEWDMPRTTIWVNIPAWPISRTGKAQLDLKPELAEVDNETVTKRLLVSEGRTYSIRKGKPLSFCDFIDTDDDPHAFSLGIE